MFNPMSMSIPPSAAPSPWAFVTRCCHEVPTASQFEAGTQVVCKFSALHLKSKRPRYSHHVSGAKFMFNPMSMSVPPSSAAPRPWWLVTQCYQDAPNLNTTIGMGGEGAKPRSIRIGMASSRDAAQTAEAIKNYNAQPLQSSGEPHASLELRMRYPLNCHRDGDLLLLSTL
jgi:hypothetical protein